MAMSGLNISPDPTYPDHIRSPRVPVCVCGLSNRSLPPFRHEPPPIGRILPRSRTPKPMWPHLRIYWCAHVGSMVSSRPPVLPRYWRFAMRATLNQFSIERPSVQMALLLPTELCTLRASPALPWHLTSPTLQLAPCIAQYIAPLTCLQCPIPVRVSVNCQPFLSVVCLRVSSLLSNLCDDG